MTELAPEPLTILYRNHRGEVAPRRIIPRSIRWGTELPWHPEPTWLIAAHDLDKGADRTFAVPNILHWATASLPVTTDIATIPAESA